MLAGRRLRRDEISQLHGVVVAALGEPEIGGLARDHAIRPGEVVGGPSTLGDDRIDRPAWTGIGIQIVALVGEPWLLVDWRF